MLEENVTYCLMPNCAIFLDVRRDAYFAIDTKERPSWNLVFLGNEPLSSAPDLMRMLKERGLLRAGQTDDRILCDIRPVAANDSLLERGYSRRPVNPLGLIDAIIAFAWARRRIRAGRLEQALRELRDISRLARKSQAQCIDASRSFHACRRLVPVQPRCLVDSLALRMFLARRRLDADLIFGVQNEPFLAHCWVQSGSLILNDALHHTRSFVPIRCN